MTSLDSSYPIRSIPDYALPPFVLTEADRERWELSHAIATEIGRQNDPSGGPNSAFVFHMTRTVYFGDLPTGEPGDPAAPLDSPLA